MCFYMYPSSIDLISDTKNTMQYDPRFFRLNFLIYHSCSKMPVKIMSGILNCRLSSQICGLLKEGPFISRSPSRPKRNNRRTPQRNHRPNPIPPIGSHPFNHPPPPQRHQNKHSPIRRIPPRKPHHLKRHDHPIQNQNETAGDGQVRAFMSGPEGLVDEVSAADFAEPTEEEDGEGVEDLKGWVLGGVEGFEKVREWAVGRGVLVRVHFWLWDM
ncbi:hypothetical protein DFS34DRAFT_252078 [Phlyctochytrium arcticum]|nr:hypothetical protein DFS34DRAFT_252078 [Phlyctochytrium arcticum]